MPNIYVTLLLLTLGHFLIDYMIGIWAVYKTIADLDIAKAGLIAGFSALAGEGLQILFGSLSDQGYRRLLITAGLFATTASALLAYTHDYSYLFILFLLTCMGSGAFHPAAAGLIGQLSKNRKSVFLAIFVSGGALGLACSQLIFTAVYENFGANTIYLAIPTLCLITFLIFYGLVEIPIAKPKAKTRIDFKTFGKFFKHKNLRNLYLTQLFSQSVFWGLIFLLPDLLEYREYSDWVSYGGAHFCMIIGGAFMIIPGGYIADRFSPKKVLLATQIIYMVLFYIVLANPTLSPQVLCTILFFMGTTGNLVAPVTLALGNHMAPSKPGMVSAFLMGLVWCLAEGIGQGGGGLLTTLFDENPSGKALTIIGFLMIGSIIATSLLKVKISDEEKCEFAV